MEAPGDVLAGEGVDPLVIPEGEAGFHGQTGVAEIPLDPVAIELHGRLRGDIPADKGPCLDPLPLQECGQLLRAEGGVLTDRHREAEPGAPATFRLLLEPEEIAVRSELPAPPSRVGGTDLD